MIAQNYEIRLRGSLSPALANAFAPMRRTTEDGGRVTVLAGMLDDQSELSGILTALDSLGLQLLEIRPTAAAHSAGGHGTVR